MTKKRITLTHVIMIADMSGSMHSLAEDVRGGFNGYVSELRSKPGNYLLTATVFDTTVTQLCQDVTLDRVPKLTNENYSPCGMTALLDAVGETVTKFESRVKLRKTEQVLVVIQTDGEENSSKDWTYGSVKKLIQSREEAGQWGFIYLGVGLDTWGQANQMGIKRDQYINTMPTRYGTAGTYSGLVGTTMTYSSGVSAAGSTSVLRDSPGVENTNKGASQQ